MSPEFPRLCVNKRVESTLETWRLLNRKQELACSADAVLPFTASRRRKPFPLQVKIWDFNSQDTTYLVKTRIRRTLSIQSPSRYLTFWLVSIDEFKIRMSIVPRGAHRFH